MRPLKDAMEAGLVIIFFVFLLDTRMHALIPCSAIAAALVAFATHRPLDLREDITNAPDLIMTALREITHGSDEYRRECNLRQEVLRRPLGLDLFEEDLNAESDQLHFGLFEEEVLLACIVAVVVSPIEAELRQMAVLPRMQGCGYGRRLLELLEEELVSRGYAKASLHARTSVVDFYKKLGFEPVGNEFIEVGIPHLKMTKLLTKHE